MRTPPQDHPIRLRHISTHHQVAVVIPTQHQVVSMATQRLDLATRIPLPQPIIIQHHRELITLQHQDIHIPHQVDIPIQPLLQAVIRLLMVHQTMELHHIVTHLPLMAHRQNLITPLPMALHRTIPLLTLTQLLLFRGYQRLEDCGSSCGILSLVNNFLYNK